jgi:DNA-binding NarL/FixJ family response regulator
MKKILIVDDSEAVRGAVRYRLESQTGLEVCGEAVDGLDAIEKAKQLRPDLILLDLNMPKMNGAAAAVVLKRLNPEVPIILFTMYEDAVETVAPLIGVDVVLSKPSGLSNLIERIQGLLQSRGQQGRLSN